MADNEIHVPDLGDFKDVLVIDVLVKAGDSVDVESPLITLETDKATMDVPSPIAGVIGQLHVSKGDRVSTGTLLATLSGGEKTSAVSGAQEKPAAADAGETPERDAGEPDAGAAAGKDEASTVEQVETPKTTDAAQAEARPASKAAKKAAPAAKTEEPPKKDSAPAAAMSAQAPAASEKTPASAASAQVASPGAPPSGVSAPVAAPPAPTDEAGFAKAHASPSVRALARELGVDLSLVSGRGRGGRITSEDVKGFVKAALASAGAAPASAAGGAALPAVPAVDFAKFGPVEVVPLSRIQRISGPRLHASWVNVPHVTQLEDADITELEEARKWLKLRAANENIPLTALAFVIRACALAIEAFPKFGASLDASGQNLVMKKYCHIGFAADTPDGLVVPVIRDANRKDVFELARALGDLSGKARTGKLTAADMQGGCFTVSNLGGIGGTSFTPIINAPEVAVLGVSRSVKRPVWRDGAFVPRLVLPLSLSYDHRVIDGAAGTRFAGFLAEALGDVARLMAAPS